MWSSILSSEAADSTLADSSGGGGPVDSDRRRSGRTEVSVVLSGLTQKVSRVHSRQLKFSNRRPSSMNEAHLEKAVGRISLRTTTD